MPSDRLLVHTCCAPCLCAMLEPLKSRSGGFVAYFSNPNIHPLIEFRRRLKAVQVLAARDALPLIVDAHYGLEAFLDALGGQRARPQRCRTCTRLRLDAAARCAAENRIAAFTSTLLVSPQQDREAICELGHAAAERHGVSFDDTDRRPLHALGLELAASMQLYRQQYCGCIFSENERYGPTTRHLYRGSQEAADS